MSHFLFLFSSLACLVFLRCGSLCSTQAVLALRIHWLKRLECYNYEDKSLGLGMELFNFFQSFWKFTGRSQCSASGPRAQATACCVLSKPLFSFNEQTLGRILRFLQNESSSPVSAQSYSWRPFWMMPCAACPQKKQTRGWVRGWGWKMTVDATSHLISTLCEFLSFCSQSDLRVSRSYTAAHGKGEENLHTSQSRYLHFCFFTLKCALRLPWPQITVEK